MATPSVSQREVRLGSGRRKLSPRLLETDARRLEGLGRSAGVLAGIAPRMAAAIKVPRLPSTRAAPRANATVIITMPRPSSFQPRGARLLPFLSIAGASEGR